MSRVIFMCGPSGSGKSTYAQRFESEGVVRLSFDVEMWRRGISTGPLPQDVRDEIEAGVRAAHDSPGSQRSARGGRWSDRDAKVRLRRGATL